MRVWLAAGLVILLAACGRDVVTPEPTPSAISTDPEYVAAIERIGLWARCLQEKGFDVQHDGLTGTTSNIPEEQEEAYKRAADVCSKEADARYPPPPPPSEDEFWELNLESAVCLKAQGYTISEPPTEEAWKDAYPERVIWHPWGEVPYAGQEEWNRLNLACPQPGAGAAR